MPNARLGYEQLISKPDRHSILLVPVVEDDGFGLLECQFEPVGRYLVYHALESHWQPFF